MQTAGKYLVPYSKWQAKRCFVTKLFGEKTSQEVFLRFMARIQNMRCASFSSTNFPGGTHMHANSGKIFSSIFEMAGKALFCNQVVWREDLPRSMAAIYGKNP
ncbi:MAG: hypothetical protein GY942_25480 [Aestuariibacter sp.]|nr:hypothetical protein [Aestuariibacter sp.]